MDENWKEGRKGDKKRERRKRKMIKREDRFKKEGIGDGRREEWRSAH